MALDDVVFTSGEIQNFVLEIPTGNNYPPKDMVAENGSNLGCLLVELPAITATSSVPETIILSDGKLAKRISDTFYLKL